MKKIYYFWFFKKKKIIWLFLLIIFLKHKYLLADIYNTLGLYHLGKDVLISPYLFFQTYQYEIENLNPSFLKKYLPSEWIEISKNKYDNVIPYPFFKKFSISTSPSSLILSVFNYHIKGQLLYEAIYLPQITLGFGHHFYVPLYNNLIDDKNVEVKKFIESIDFMALSTDIILSKSISYNVKLFTGYRFSYGWLNWEIQQYINNKFEYSVNELINMKNNYVWQLHDLIFGISYLIPYSKWESTSYLGFDPNIINVFIKIEMANRFFGFGLGYYPNNILKLRPFFRLFYNFI